MFGNIKNNWEKLPEEKKQNYKGILFISAAGLILFSIIISIKPQSNQSITISESKYDISSEKSEIEDVWLMESEEKMANIADQLKKEAIEKDRLQDRIIDLEEKLDIYLESSSQTEYLLKEIEALKKNQNNNKPINNNGNTTNNNSFNGQDSFRRGNVSSGNANNQYIETSVPETKSILVVDFSDDEEKKNYDLKKYLPAGSYAKAVLISAVDASVGLSSQSDPRPVLFRILGEAKSAIKDDQEQLSVKIDGCTVTGAASGDLSSERAYVRLLKMTCADGDRAIETDVEGYAADGSDGKSGISGKIVSREGDLITKSFLAGAVSGIGKGISSKFEPEVSYDGLAASSNITTEDIMGQGLGEGVSQSSQNVADYLIKRAEQYQPVVSIASGKEVELVFISGVYLDGRVVNIEQEGSNKSSGGKFGFNN